MKKLGLGLLTAMMLLAITLTACFGGSPSVDKVSEALKDNSYMIISTVEASDEGAGATLKMNGIKTVVTATKLTDTVVVRWYDSSSKAKDAYEKATNGVENPTTYRSGNMVATGSSAAIEVIKSVG